MQIPRSFKIVPYVFIAAGVIGVVNTLRATLVDGRFFIDPDMLGLGVGIGLLRYDANWRLVAMGCSLCWIICASILVILGSVLYLEPSVSALHFQPPDRDKVLLLIGTSAILAVYAIWQFSLLKSKAVRDVFEPPD